MPQADRRPHGRDGRPDFRKLFKTVLKDDRFYTPFKINSTQMQTGYTVPARRSQGNCLRRDGIEYQYPKPYGSVRGWYPTSITKQRTNTAQEVVQRPGGLWILTEFPGIRR